MISRLIFAVLLAAGICGAAPAPAINEYDVKAAFLLSFVRYVAWPPEVFRDLTDPLVICVLGRDPFGRILDDMTAGKAIEGRSLVVRRITDAKNAVGCRVLFVASADRKLAFALPDASLESGILTVGETGNQVASGMVLNFTLEEGKVRFTVNMEAADRERVRLSSRLLALATSVKR
jgi:YfiR/HmsC-like